MAKIYKITQENLEVRMAEPNATMAEGNTVFGRAISYEVESDNLRFTEIIHRGAVTDELLQNSDVYCRVNHSDDYIVARWNKGKGSLRLENRADGLYYSFDIPNTEKGKELAEHIRRGEITNSSFSFVVDADGERWSRRNGKPYHEVNRISYLHDVAPVFLPAYNSSTCSLRAAEIITQLENEDMTDETKKENKVKETVETTTTNTVTTVTKKVEEITEESKQNDNTNIDIVADSVTNVSDTGNNEERAAETDEEEVTEETTTEETEEQEDTEEVRETTEETTDEETTDEETEQETTDNKEHNRNININMKTKKFSLVTAINSVVANQPMDAVTYAVNRAGQNELVKSGRGYVGQICLPLNNRDGISVETEGADLVGVEVWDITKPLYAKSALVQSGARVLDNLTSDVCLPSGNAATVYWEGELETAGDSNITFGGSKLQPKRLCATTLISKKLLVQSQNESIEEYVRNTIIEAVRAKLEETILGDAAGTTEKPAGMRYNKTVTTVTDFADLVDAEASVDGMEDYNPKSYILSNKAKAAFRAMEKGTGGNGMVMQDGEIDGTAAITTAALTDKNFIYGDFSNVVIGNFSGLDIVVDSISAAAQAAVKITINFWVDYALVRDNFVYGKIGA